ncbi:MAG: STAS/SEC14 domain-containing protein [Chloroflexota bacterium]
MPTTEQWLNKDIIVTTWHNPLRSSEIADCFMKLKEELRNHDDTVHILFDIRGVPSIPTQAPLHFVKSELPRQDNLGLIAVIGLQAIAQILAQMASHMSGQPIVFFPDEDSAMAYIQENA